LGTAICYCQQRGRGDEQARRLPATTVDVTNRQDLRKVTSCSFDGVTQQVQSVLNGHGQPQPRPSRLELDDDTDSGQNAALPAAASATAAVAPTVSNDLAAQLPSSAATTGNKTQPTKITATAGNTEMNGNTQSSSSDAVVVSGVPLPSPPLTPPTSAAAVVKSSLQTVGGQIVLPSPARGYRSPHQDARKNSTPDSVELLPPPSPPLQFSQSLSLDSPPGGVLPPPPLDDSLYMIPPRVSPPPPMSPVLSAAMANLMGSGATSSKSVASAGEVSTFVSIDQATSLVDGLSALSDRMSGFEGEAQDCSVESGSSDQPPVRDTRSDLLAAIREGTYMCVCVCCHALFFLDK